MNNIGLVANLYNEANALPGWLETHLPFFDDVRVLHAGPGGEYSNDGTMEILEKWKIPVQYCAIDDGFGVVRTKALRMCPCDWVMLLDIDERFYPLHRNLYCLGEATPQDQVDWILQGYDFRGVRLPNWENIAKLGENLKVQSNSHYNQGNRLREIISNPHTDAIITCRRHWHDLGMTRPTQNWHNDPDWQMRTVRNKPNIHFSSDSRMHEQLRGYGGVQYAHAADGPFFEHFHFHFKQMEQEQRTHDVSIYDRIHEGKPPMTLKEFRSQR